MERFSVNLEGHAGIADSEGWETNPFARDILGIWLPPENLSKLGKSSAHIGLVLSDIHSEVSRFAPQTYPIPQAFPQIIYSGAFMFTR